MQVYLDDKPLRTETTFAGGVRAAIDAAAASGRVVIEAYLDGAIVADAILESPPEEELGRELRLTSVDPRSLVAGTLTDAMSALHSAEADQKECAELIQAGNVEEALAPLSSMIQTWQAVREAVEKSAAITRVSLDDMVAPQAGGASGADRVVNAIASLSTRLEEIKRCLGSQDWSALADVVGYDMGEEAERWRRLLGDMVERFRT